MFLPGGEQSHIGVWSFVLLPLLSISALARNGDRNQPLIAPETQTDLSLMSKTGLALTSRLRYSRSTY